MAESFLATWTSYLLSNAFPIEELNWVRRDKGLKRNIEYILSFSVARINYSAKYFYSKKLNKTKRSYLFILKHKSHS